LFFSNDFFGGDFSGMFEDSAVQSDCPNTKAICIGWGDSNATSAGLNCTQTCTPTVAPTEAPVIVPTVTTATGTSTTGTTATGTSGAGAGAGGLLAATSSLAFAAFLWLSVPG